MKRIIILTFLAGSCLNARAQSNEHDVVMWTSAMITYQFSQTPYTIQTFIQTRFIQNATQFQTAVLSIWGLYRFMASMSVGIGYTILTPINNRILDILALQLFYDTRISNLPLSIRFRAENLTWRSPDDFFVEIISTTRFRLRPELIIPLWTNYGLLLNDEIFWRLNEPILNQNRAQIGIRYREGKWVVDVLYQHRFINQVANLPKRIEHALLLNFFYTIRQ